jgi:hypothetical protein
MLMRCDITCGPYSTFHHPTVIQYTDLTGCHSLCLLGLKGFMIVAAAPCQPSMSVSTTRLACGGTASCLLRMHELLQTCIPSGQGPRQIRLISSYSVTYTVTTAWLPVRIFTPKSVIDTHNLAATVLLRVISPPITEKQSAACIQNQTYHRHHSHHQYA